MTLDDIVDGVKKKDKIGMDGAEAGALKSTIERIKAGKGRSDDGNYNKGIMQLAIRNTGELPPELADMSFLELLPVEELNPIVDKYLPKAYENTSKRLIENVGPEYKEILKEIDGNSMLGITSNMPIPGIVKKEYEKIKEAQEQNQKYSKIIEKEDVDEYLNTVENPAVREILEKAKEKDKNAVLKYAQIRAQMEQVRFLSYFTDNPKALLEALKEKDLKSINKNLKADKLRDYVTEGIEGMPKRDGAYETIGLAYASYLHQIETEKRNKEAKDSLESSLERKAA